MRTHIHTRRHRFIFSSSTRMYIHILDIGTALKTIQSCLAPKVHNSHHSFRVQKVPQCIYFLFFLISWLRYTVIPTRPVLYTHTSTLLGKHEENVRLNEMYNACRLFYENIVFHGKTCTSNSADFGRNATWCVKNLLFFD